MIKPAKRDTIPKIKPWKAKLNKMMQGIMAMMTPNRTGANTRKDFLNCLNKLDIAVTISL